MKFHRTFDTLRLFGELPRASRISKGFRDGSCLTSSVARWVLLPSCLPPRDQQNTTPSSKHQQQTGTPLNTPTCRALSVSWAMSRCSHPVLDEQRGCFLGVVWLVLASTLRFAFSGVWRTEASLPTTPDTSGQAKQCQQRAQLA